MAIVDESNPASTAPGQIPGGASASPTGGEPQAAAAEPEPASEPTAEPTAAPEPAPEPVPQTSFPSADEFGWDAWEGAAEGLPEEIQSWHGKFNERWETQRQELNEAVASAEAKEAQWKRYYESVFTGDEDPRISETSEQLAVLQQVHDTYKSQAEAREKAYTELLEKDAERYIMGVRAEHGEYMDSLTPEQGEQVMGLLDHDYELHDALVISKSGPEALAEAVKLREQGTPPEVALRLIAAEYTPQRAAAAAAAAPPKPSPASRVVAGADGTERNPVTAPKPKKPVGRMAALRAAARAAAAKHAT